MYLWLFLFLFFFAPVRVHLGSLSSAFYHILTFWVLAVGVERYLLFLRLNEFVVLHRHLAAQSLTGVCCRAVGVDEVGSCITDSRGLKCAE